MRREELEELIRPVLQDEGLELVLCSVARGGRIQNIRVLLDHPAGLSVEACARASRRIAILLDANPILRSAYSLEVSSPGMNRPIWSAEHFRRFAGERVRISLNESAALPHFVVGVIGPEEGGGFWIDVSEDWRDVGEGRAAKGRTSKAKPGKRAHGAKETRTGRGSNEVLDIEADPDGVQEPGPGSSRRAESNQAAHAMSATEVAAPESRPNLAAAGTRRLIRLEEISQAELDIDPWKRRNSAETK